MTASFARRFWPLLLLVVLSGTADAKPRIERAADLPRFSYAVSGKVEDLIRDPGKFAPFAAQVARDTKSVLDDYDIPDKATRRDLISQLALIDFLEGRYDDAARRAASLRDLEDKPAAKLLAGLRLEIMSRAALQHGLGTEAYTRAVADALAKALAAMPYEVIGNDIKEAKEGAELTGEALVLGRAREVWQPIVDKDGKLSSDIASSLVGRRFTLVATLPLKATLVQTYGAYLKAHQVVKPDIWAARDVELPSGKPYAPVRIAVWDGGVDTALFPGRILREADGSPAVIAFDKYSRPAQGALMALTPAQRERLPQMVAREKGFADLTSNIDSPEASEVKSFLSQLPPDQYKPAMEELELADSYMHGSHVAGIAMAGNPYARLVVGRMEYPWTLMPDPCPSLEQAEADAKSQIETVAFFQREGVRVVNMSWGGDVAGIESDLEKCGIGKSVDERKALARKYFDIERDALVKAFTGAPDILFVAAAGNSDSNASFIEDVPAGIDLPNLLVVAAVDQAGDEAGFTSYGPTVKVDANGYQVESFLPGGTRVAMSGTSMASPQVANLAAKILAVNPKLTPVEAIKIIVDTSEASADGRRHLIDPKKALAAAGMN